MDHLYVQYVVELCCSARVWGSAACFWISAWKTGKTRANQEKKLLTGRTTKKKQKAGLFDCLTLCHQYPNLQAVRPPLATLCGSVLFPGAFVVAMRLLHQASQQKSKKKDYDGTDPEPLKFSASFTYFVLVTWSKNITKVTFELGSNVAHGDSSAANPQVWQKGAVWWKNHKSESFGSGSDCKDFFSGKSDWWKSGPVWILKAKGNGLSGWKHGKHGPVLILTTQTDWIRCGPVLALKGCSGMPGRSKAFQPKASLQTLPPWGIRSVLFLHGHRSWIWGPHQVRQSKSISSKNFTGIAKDSKIFKDVILKDSEGFWRILTSWFHALSDTILALKKHRNSTMLSRFFVWSFLFGMSVADVLDVFWMCCCLNIVNLKNGISEMFCVKCSFKTS